MRQVWLLPQAPGKLWIQQQVWKRKEAYACKLIYFKHRFRDARLELMAMRVYAEVKDFWSIGAGAGDYALELQATDLWGSFPITERIVASRTYDAGRYAKLELGAVWEKLRCDAGASLGDWHNGGRTLVKRSLSWSFVGTGLSRRYAAIEPAKRWRFYFGAHWPGIAFCRKLWNV